MQRLTQSTVPLPPIAYIDWHVARTEVPGTAIFYVYFFAKNRKGDQPSVVPKDTTCSHGFAEIRASRSIHQHDIRERLSPLYRYCPPILGYLRKTHHPQLPTMLS